MEIETDYANALFVWASLSVSIGFPTTALLDKFVHTLRS
jgi:hypothetical protein